MPASATQAPHVDGAAAVFGTTMLESLKLAVTPCAPIVRGSTAPDGAAARGGAEEGGGAALPVAQSASKETTMQTR